MGKTPDVVRVATDGIADALEEVRRIHNEEMSIPEHLHDQFTHEAAFRYAVLLFVSRHEGMNK